MNTVILDASECESEDRVVLDGERAAHIRTVLQARIGDTIRIGVLNGPLGTATIESLEPVVLRITLGATPPLPRIDLLLAMPRPKALGRLYSPIAQLGIRHLVLSGAAKVERCYFDAHQVRPAFARAHLIEGLSQVGDTHMPEISIHRRFDSALAALHLDHRWRLVADPSGELSLLDAAPLNSEGVDAAVLLAIGPEGGWTGDELERFARRGFESVHLGRRTLRTDVALIGLLTMLHAKLAR